MTVEEIKQVILSEISLDSTKSTWQFPQWKSYFNTKITSSKTIDFVSLIPWLSGGAYKKLDLPSSNANYSAAKCLLLILTQLSVPIDLNQIEIKNLVNTLVTAGVLTTTDRTNLINIAVIQTVRYPVEDGDLQAALAP